MKWLIIAQIVALLIWYPLGRAAKRGDERCPIGK